MSGRIFLGWTSTKQGPMCLVQWYNAVTPVRLESATPRSPDKSTTEPLRSLCEGGDHVGSCVPQRLHNQTVTVVFCKQTSSAYIENCVPFVSLNEKASKRAFSATETIFHTNILNLPNTADIFSRLRSAKALIILRAWRLCCSHIRVSISVFFLITLILNLKAPRKKCIWKCRLLKSSTANNCLTFLTNSL